MNITPLVNLKEAIDPISNTMAKLEVILISAHKIEEFQVNLVDTFFIRKSSQKAMFGLCLCRKQSNKNL